MSVQPRPADSVTEDFLLLGLPVVEYSFQLPSGAFGPYFGLGILDSVEVQKALQFAALRNSASGRSQLIRELVREFDSSLEVATFRHSGENMQLIFASSTLVTQGAATVAVAADVVNLSSDALDFLDLANQLVLESPTPTSAPATITSEAIGTGVGGTFGETTGDFALDFKPLVIGDVTAFSEGGVDRLADLVAGSAPLAGEIGIEVGATATSGQITYPSGEAPASGDALVATYTPSFGALVENTDFMLDYNSGRIRIVGPFDGNTDRFRTGQPITIGYSYSQIQGQVIKPYTQFTFPGKCRIRQLTDVGANLIWVVPKTQVRLTEEAFAFNRDDLTRSNLAVQFLEDTSVPTDPYGEMTIYREGSF